MKYTEMMYMWETLHPNVSLFERITINPYVDKDMLAQYIYDECQSFECITNNELQFERMLVNTFKLWSPNIDRLVKVITAEHDPLSDYSKKYKENKDKDGVNKKDGSTVESYEDNKNNNGEISQYHSSYNMGNEDVVLTDKETHENHEDGGGKTDSKFGNTGAYSDNINTVGEISGMLNHTYQELEELEVEHAKFNIYKWIVDNVVIKHLFIALYD